MEAPNGMGWSSINDDGYFWVYRTEQGIQATCTYTYMKVSGVEQWKGKINKKQTSFYGGTGTVAKWDLENLVGCVEWVEDYLMGGYWL